MFSQRTNCAAYLEGLLIQQGIDGLYVQWRQYPCCYLQLCPSDQLRVESQIVIALRRCVVCSRTQQVDDGAAPDFITLPGSIQRYFCGSYRLLRGLELSDAVLQVKERSLCIQFDLVLNICEVRVAGF